MTKRIDPALLTPIVGTLYPTPFDVPCRARQRRKLGDGAGLTQFGRGHGREVRGEGGRGGPTDNASRRILALSVA
jgi:uncharacterized cupin superfamily protein